LREHRGHFMTYVSGMSATTDYAGCADAGIPVGVQVQDLSAAVERQIAEYANLGGLTFVDSGAFKAFIKKTTVDFDMVLDRYERLATMTDRPENLAVVAPDVIGTMDETAALQRFYLLRIKRLAKMGVELLMPFQQGWETAAYVAHYRFLEAAFGPITLAFACNAAAWKPAAVAKLIRVIRPNRVHLLGVGTKNLDAYSDAVMWNSPSAILSSDANRTRVFLGKGRAITEDTRTGVKAIYQEAAEEFDQCYDGTEMDFDLHHSPGYLEVAEAKELAILFRVTKKCEIDRWGKWSQEETDARFLKAQGECEIEWGCKLGFLIEQADPYRYLLQTLVHGHEGGTIKEMVATLAAKHRQKEARRAAISKTLSADHVRRQSAYRIRSSQIVMFQAA